MKENENTSPPSWTQMPGCQQNPSDDEVQGPHHLRYLTRKRRKSQAEGGNCCSAFRMWLLQNMVSWC